MQNKKEDKKPMDLVKVAYNEEVNSNGISQNEENIKFYRLVFNNKTSKSEIKIDVYQLLTLLRGFGFRRYDLEGSEDFTFVKITDNIIKEVSRNHIIDYFFEWLDKTHNDPNVTLSSLKEQLIKGISTYFSKDILARLVLEKPINFMIDGEKESYFYFKNKVVRVSGENIDSLPYKDLQGCIWERQIIPRNFSFSDNYNEGAFYEFCFLVSGQNLQKLKSLASLIGYLLHDYKGGKRKAVNFTDGSLDNKNNGRSGKTLLAKAIGKLKVYTEINGKDFKADDKHKYQDCNLDTQIINLNDVKKGFTLESIYNDITEAVKVEGKNKKPFYIITKFIICSNRPLQTQGGSDKDRVIEFEFSVFFSESYQPQDHFKQWFFNNWNEQQWNDFDTFMLSSVQLYLQEGIIEPVNENLQRRKLFESTDEDFIKFIEAEELLANEKYDKKKLYEDYQNAYGRNHNISQKRFTSWLQTYAQLSGKFAGFVDGIDRNPYVSFIIFKPKI